ncbi:TRAP transporter substrate-binding protein [Chiayiivirga flava]|uniref:TRAP-type mannitol/chloroaromatic compound transport system substrate-binding protein n=1 Tax=Chiayiivirga flava TaxID=659595 RepID=A0A7W8D6E5_9GAMM|nr:TRAP transporter substrate-binding protein [Chiayiivirga flava]MBB5207571.1 TRAP-type mannitol/chloroaromatic compound transport system substrate-binding protein [Chiayiivirga flava]
MHRRAVLGTLGGAALGAGLAGCGPPPSAPAAAQAPPLRWTMVTSWPSDFPGMGTAAKELAQLVGRASGGRLTVDVFGAGEKVAPFDVFDAVADGTAQMGHSAAYYWRTRSPAAPFFCTVPFGMTALEMSAWLYDGGGLALWRELYAGFGLVPFPCGSTGAQTAGWFNREIRRPADLRGLKMRIPGLGGEVMARLGAAPVNVPGAELFDALKSGELDASEWVGPYDDLAFGLHRAAKFCYVPAWQEPGTILECTVNATAWNALADDLKAIVDTCCRAVNESMLAGYAARNQQALAQLRDEHGVVVRELPRDVLAALRRASEAVLDDLVADDPFAQRVFDSYTAFRRQAMAWAALSDDAYSKARR